VLLKGVGSMTMWRAAMKITERVAHAQRLSRGLQPYCTRTTLTSMHMSLSSCQRSWIWTSIASDILQILFTTPPLESSIIHAA